MLFSVPCEAYHPPAAAARVRSEVPRSGNPARPPAPALYRARRARRRADSRARPTRLSSAELRTRLPPLAHAGVVSIYAVRTILSIIMLVNMRFKHSSSSVSNSAANSAAELPSFRCRRDRQFAIMGLIIRSFRRFWDAFRTLGRDISLLAGNSLLLCPSRGADR